LHELSQILMSLGSPTGHSQGQFLLIREIRVCIFRLVEESKNSHALAVEYGSRTGSIYHHALESCACRGKRRRRSAELCGSLSGAMPDLLATCFFIRMPPWVFDRGCAGHYAGFFFNDFENELAPPSQPRPRPVSVALAKVSPEFSSQRH
jgi:hypothetical protein